MESSQAACVYAAQPPLRPDRPPHARPGGRQRTRLAAKSMFRPGVRHRPARGGRRLQGPHRGCCRQRRSLRPPTASSDRRARTRSDQPLGPRRWTADQGSCRYRKRTAGLMSSSARRPRNDRTPCRGGSRCSRAVATNTRSGSSGQTAISATADIGRAQGDATPAEQAISRSPGWSRIICRQLRPPSSDRQRPPRNVPA